MDGQSAGGLEDQPAPALHGAHLCLHPASRSVGRGLADDSRVRGADLDAGHFCPRPQGRVDMGILRIGRRGRIGNGLRWMAQIFGRLGRRPRRWRRAWEARACVHHPAAADRPAPSTKRPPVPRQGSDRGPDAVSGPAATCPPGGAAACNPEARLPTTDATGWPTCSLSRRCLEGILGPRAAAPQRERRK